jgi:hypothetical protein
MGSLLFSPESPPGRLVRGAAPRVLRLFHLRNPFALNLGTRQTNGTNTDRFHFAHQYGTYRIYSTHQPKPVAFSGVVSVGWAFQPGYSTCGGWFKFMPSARCSSVIRRARCSYSCAPAAVMPTNVAASSASFPYDTPYPCRSRRFHVLRPGEMGESQEEKPVERSKQSKTFAAI